MKIVKNHLIPFSDFLCMTVFCWIFVRHEKRWRLTNRAINHEQIHWYQIIGLWLVTVPVFIVVAAFGLVSWWWGLCLVPIYYLLYFLFWIIETILPPYSKAYKDSPFEREAKANERDFNYPGFKHCLSWVRYIRVKR